MFAASCSLLVVAVAARWLLGAALRPVARMTRQAAEWSEHDLDRRFALGAPHDELTELAATLDSLLDRVAASLRHEQRFSAELSHELRTPLARDRRRGRARAPPRARSRTEYRARARVVLRNADQLARTIDALVAAAQHEAGWRAAPPTRYAVAASGGRGVRSSSPRARR